MNSEPSSDRSINAAEIVSNVIRSRQTFKVLGDPDHPLLLTAEQIERGDLIVHEAVKTAAWAPFHYERGLDGLAEPWRVDFVSGQDCRTVATQFREWFADVKPSNKIPAMLSACGALVLVSWLPQFSFQRSMQANDGGGPDANSQNEIARPPEEDKSMAARIQTDEEHLAATAAYIQNLLLVLTANGLGTYWSSGAQFRSHAMFERLGLKHRGRLLGAIFVDYSNDTSDPVQRLAGKHRTRRCPEHDWFHCVQLNSAET